MKLKVLKKNYLIGLFLVCLVGCGGSNDATETNLTRLRCESNVDCSEGVSCVYTKDDLTGEEKVRFCNDNSEAVSNNDSASSLMLKTCAKDSDCGEKISCLYDTEITTQDVQSFDFGFCDSESCPKRCQTPTDEVTDSECSTSADCGADQFCAPVACHFVL